MNVKAGRAGVVTAWNVQHASSTAPAASLIALDSKALWRCSISRKTDRHADRQTQTDIQTDRQSDTRTDWRARCGGRGHDCQPPFPRQCRAPLRAAALFPPCPCILAQGLARPGKAWQGPDHARARCLRPASLRATAFSDTAFTLHTSKASASSAATTLGPEWGGEEKRSGMFACARQELMTATMHCGVEERRCPALRCPLPCVFSISLPAVFMMMTTWPPADKAEAIRGPTRQRA